MVSATPVGIIGVGLMGEVYAHRLIAAGFAVVGCDVDPARNARLAQIGGRAETLAAIARDCDPIVLAVFNTDQVEDVVERALIPAAAGKIVIATSTCDPDRIAALAARVADKLRFLEVPVSGTSEQVRQGDGVGLIGGDARIAQAAAPVLDALVPKRFHIGNAGDGGRTKLAVNLILGLNRLALAEGLVFAARLGLDPEAFLNVARASAAASQVMDTKGPKMIAGDFAPQGLQVGFRALALPAGDVEDVLLAGPRAQDPAVLQADPGHGIDHDRNDTAQSRTRTTRGPDSAEVVQAAATSDSGKVRNGTWTEPSAMSRR